MILPTTERYNYHSHTEFCDGRAPMSGMAAAACSEGMEIWGFSPHSPIPVESGCNMQFEAVPIYLEEASRIKGEYEGRMKILTSMEIDYLSTEWGPHVDYFQKLPLDYRIGSVHFVMNQDGIPIDCDGRFERFNQRLKDSFRGDLRYIVEKFYEQELIMIERGGFDVLGHFDKISANASMVDPEIENTGWYQALVDDVIRHARDAGIIFEINTKAFNDKGRFFPNRSLWKELPDKSKGETLEGIIHKKILINSDAHYPEKVNCGRDEAIKLFHEEIINQ
ncbi:MAG: histidinol-phosphatase [Muribaculaceae bacterium]|nr:histidinol-phosphatase [Muribaculaceae bacterium]